MRRRDLIACLGACSLLSGRARAEQAPPSMIGYLHSGTPDLPGPDKLDAFRASLSEADFVDGRNIEIAYRYANDRPELLLTLANELVGAHVAVLVAGGGARAIITAETATKTIPIVFIVGGDPVSDKLVPNLNRPGGNVTGVSFFSTVLEAKRFALLREMVPRAATIGYLNDPAFPATADPSVALGKQIVLVDAKSAREIEAAFANFRQHRVGALFVGASPFLTSQRDQIVALAARDAIPASYSESGAVDAGGLMSYGASITDAYRQAGAYVAKILRGASPGDLPVLQPRTFELVINLHTARALGLTVPQSLLLAADRVIE